MLPPALFLATVLAAPRDAGALVLPPPLPSSVDETTRYELQRQPDGGYAWDGDAFGARIAADGSVHFQDHHMSAVSWLPWRPLATPNQGPSIESTLRDLLGGKRGRRGPSPGQGDRPLAEPRATLFRRMSPNRPDPTDACKYPMACWFQAAVLLIEVAGRFDVTDELVRLSGHDPYGHEKARFLAATRDLRTRLALRAHAAAVCKSSSELPARLESIATDERLPPADRAALLRALAEEIDDSSAEGRAARARIRDVLERLFGDHPDAGAARSQ
jgi:hypothetical protein